MGLVNPSTGQIILDGGNRYALSLYAAMIFDDPDAVKDWSILAFSHSHELAGGSGNGGTSKQMDSAMLSMFISATNDTGAYGSHGNMKYNAPNGVGKKGKAVIGFIHGHQHYHITTPANGIPCIGVSRSFSLVDLYTDGHPATENQYGFDIFVVDPINHYLYQIQVGRTAANDTLDVDYELSAYRVARAGGTTDEITGIYRYSYLHS